MGARVQIDLAKSSIRHVRVGSSPLVLLVIANKVLYRSGYTLRLQPVHVGGSERA